MAFSVNNQSSLWHQTVSNTEHGHIHDLSNYGDSSRGLPIAHTNTLQMAGQSNVALNLRNQAFVPTHSAFSHSPRSSGDGQHVAANSLTTTYHDPGKNHYVEESEYTGFNYQYERGQAPVQINVREFMHNFDRQVQSVDYTTQGVVSPETQAVGISRVHVDRDSGSMEGKQEKNGLNVKTEVGLEITDEKSNENNVSIDQKEDGQKMTEGEKKFETVQTENLPTTSATSPEKAVSNQIENSEGTAVKPTPESSPRKNKRKISRAQKREKPEAASDSPALFTMMKGESSGSVVNITEDSLKAMIEESLKNITASKKGKIDTKDIVDASLKSVTAAVMATTSEDPSPGPSPTKKRRKKASPQKIEIQNKDEDYDPVMDEDTEIDEDWVDTPQVKRSKVKKKRQPAKKRKKKSELNGDDLDQPPEGESEGQAAEGKEAKKKKVKTPKPRKKEKGPRIREKKELMCEICGKVFMRNDLLRNHKRCHSGDKPFVCTECGVSFREAGHLKRHMTIHTGKKPYKCEICGKELNSSLSKHRRRHLNDRQFPCTMCDKKFVCAFELKQHVQSHFKTEHMPCAICGKLCATAALMKRHLQSHSEERNHVCSVCGQKFKAKQDCERHQSIHYTTPTCTCHLCGKQFTQERYLKRHIDRHNKPAPKIIYEEITPEKPFQCSLCFKTFPSNTNLNQHIALHNNKGYYPCYICSKMFSQQKYLKRHIKRHLGEVMDSSDESMISGEEEELSRSLPPYSTMDGEEQSAVEEQQATSVVLLSVTDQSSSQMEEQA